MHRDKIIEQLKGNVASEGPVMEPEVEERDEGEGRWQRSPALGVRLLWPDQNGGVAGKTILYAWLSDDIEFEQDAEGNAKIAFCYENRRGEFRVTIEGQSLHAMYEHLSEGRRLSIRTGRNVKRIAFREHLRDGS
jgi:hypothetical protein